MRFLRDKFGCYFSNCLGMHFSEGDLVYYELNDLTFSNIHYNEKNEPIAYFFYDSNNRIHAFDLNLKRITKKEGYNKIVSKYIKSDVIAFFNDNINMDIYYKGKILFENSFNFDVIKDKYGISYLISKKNFSSCDIYDLCNEKYIVQGLSDNELSVSEIDSTQELIILTDGIDNSCLIDFNKNKLATFNLIIRFTDIPGYYLTKNKNKEGLWINDKSFIGEIPCTNKKILQITKDKVAIKNRLNSIKIISLLHSNNNSKINITQDYCFKKDVIDFWINENNFDESILTINMPTFKNSENYQKIILRDYLKSCNKNDFDINLAVNDLYDEIEYVGNGLLKFFRIINGTIVIEYNNLNVAENIKIAKSYSNGFVRLIKDDILFINDEEGELFQLDSIKSKNINELNKDFMTIPKKDLEETYIFRNKFNSIYLYNINSNSNTNRIRIKKIGSNCLVNELIVPAFHNVYYDIKEDMYYDLNSSAFYKGGDFGTVALNHYIIFLGESKFGVKVYDENLNQQVRLTRNSFWFNIDEDRKIVIFGNSQIAYMFTNEKEYYQFRIQNNININNCRIYKPIDNINGIILNDNYVSFEELQDDINSLLIPSDFKQLIS